MAANLLVPAPLFGLSFLDLMETYAIPAWVIAAFLRPGRDRNALLNSCRGLADLKQQAMYWNLTQAQSLIFCREPACVTEVNE